MHSLTLKATSLILLALAVAAAPRGSTYDYSFDERDAQAVKVRGVDIRDDVDEQAGAIALVRGVDIRADVDEQAGAIAL